MVLIGLEMADHLPPLLDFERISRAHQSLIKAHYVLVAFNATLVEELRNCINIHIVDGYQEAICHLQDMKRRLSEHGKDTCKQVRDSERCMIEQGRFKKAIANTIESKIF